VRQQPAERERAVRHTGQMAVERVVQRELVLVTEEHDRRGSEGLRDRADPVLGVLCGLTAVGLRHPNRFRPDELAAPVDGR